MEVEQAGNDVRIEKLESWVSDIHGTVKGLEKKASMALGALLVIELLIKLWR